MLAGSETTTKLVKTPGGGTVRIEGGRLGASPQQQNIGKFQRRAGFVPRAQREEHFLPGGESYATPFEGYERSVTDPYIPNVEEETIPHAKPSSRAAYEYGRKNKGPSKLRTSGIGPVEEPQRVAYPPYEIHPGMDGHAELADAIKSARILLRHGIPGDTPVAVRGAYDLHTPAGTTSNYPWTLAELADHEPAAISLTRLRDEATPRGLEIYPDGKKMIVRPHPSANQKWERTFDSHLEAARWITNQPGKAFDRRLDDPFEAALGIGKTRSFDADVDAANFQAADLQELAARELVQGKRPLIVVHSRNPQAVSVAIDAISELHGLPKGTYKTIALDGSGHGKNAVAIYDVLGVKQLVSVAQEDLSRLGIKPSATTEDLLQQLSHKQQGLAAFYGRPEGPQSALHYSWLRDHGIKEGWLNKPIAQDSMGPHRVYSPDEVLLARRGGPGSMSAGGEPPILDPTKDLGDVVKMLPDDANMHMPPHPPQAEIDDYDYYESAIRFGLDAGQEAHLARIKEGYKPASTALGWVGSFFRIPAEMFKDWETRTGVPLFQWYNAIEERRTAVEKTFGPLHENLQQLFRGTTPDLREAAQQVFDAHASGKLDSISHIKDAAALQLGETSYKFFSKWLNESLGHSSEDIQAFLAEFPQMRKSGQSFSAYRATGGGLPKLLTTASNQFERGSVVISNREMDLRRNLIRIGRAMTNEKEMEPTYNAIRKQFLAYRMADNPVTDDLVFYRFDQYARQVMHQPDHVNNALGLAFKRVAEKLEGYGMISDADAADMTSFFLSANYFGNMAFTPGIVLRNALQTLQTGTGLGMGAWSKGFKQALRYVRNEKGFEDEMIRRGVLTRDRAAQMWGDSKEMNDLILNLEGSKSKVVGKVAGFMDKGTSAFKKVEDVNHVIAYFSQHSVAEKYGKQYIAGKLSWDQFLEKSMIDMRDAKNGPLHQAIKQSLDAGELEVASHLAATDYMNATQFVYRRGTTPYWMQSTVGRLAGQYGTWPSYFAEYARNSLMRGSVKNRAKVLARWAAANTAMYQVGSQAFGVDMSRWLFFSPFGYTGGPFAETAYQGLQAVNQAVNPSSDPAAAIEAARLQNSWQQFVPLPIGQFKKTMAAYDDIQLGDYAAGVKHFLGFPEAQQ